MGPGPGPVCVEFAHFPRVFLGLLQEIPFPPTSQRCARR